MKLRFALFISLVVLFGCGEEKNPYADEVKNYLEESESVTNASVQNAGAETSGELGNSAATAPKSIQNTQWDPQPTKVKPLKGIARKRQQKYNAMINAEAAQAGIDPRFVHAIISRESVYNTNAVSVICLKQKQNNRSEKYRSNGRWCYKDDKTAHGLMQLMPDTAKQMGLTPGLRRSQPQKNVRAGIGYLNKMEWANGNLQAMAAGYNSGPARAKALLTGNKKSKYWREDGTSNGVPGPNFWGGETYKYAKYVAGYYDLYSQNPQLIGLGAKKAPSTTCYKRGC